MPDEVCVAVRAGFVVGRRGRSQPNFRQYEPTHRAMSFAKTIYLRSLLAISYSRLRSLLAISYSRRLMFVAHQSSSSIQR